MSGPRRAVPVVDECILATKAGTALAHPDKIANMSDVTTIWVAITGAIATVTNGFGGYWLAGRNDRAKDERALEREKTTRTAELTAQRTEQQNERQRDVMLELQDAVLVLTRSTALVLMHDKAALRQEGGRVGAQLPDEIGGEEGRLAVADVQRLASRVLDDQLRQQVKQFVEFCAEATTGWIPEHKHEPASVQDQIIDDYNANLGINYTNLVDRIGVHIRRLE